MKILIVSWYFPPCNTMGALRIGKLTKHLLRQGHDVRVLCAKDQPFPMTLPVEVPRERIHDTPWLDVNGFPKLVQGVRVALGLARRGRGGAAPSTADPASAAKGPEAPARPGLLRRLRDAYTLLLNIPDHVIGWLPYAIREGGRIVREWRPDVIFATGPPHTGLIVGAWLSRKAGVPWIAEYRDRWTEEPYWSPPRWRRVVDRWLEDRLIAGASAISTVSEPWAEDYRRRWGKPVTVVYNGFDPDDFPAEFERPAGDPDTLRILYTGVLYPDRRDPAPLFEALELLGDESQNVHIDFYGADPAMVAPAIERHGVADRVTVHGLVSYAESIRLQMQSDVLLLLQWNDPREQGNVPGKLFEYIAARRPVLAIGLEGGVPDRVLRAQGAGAVINDPAAIAERIREWLVEKRSHGAIPLLPLAARAGLSRPEQFAALEDLFAEVAGRQPADQPVSEAAV